QVSGAAPAIATAGERHVWQAYGRCRLVPRQQLVEFEVQTCIRRRRGRGEDSLKPVIQIEVAVAAVLADPEPEVLQVRLARADARDRRHARRGVAASLREVAVRLGALAPGVVRLRARRRL